MTAPFTVSEPYAPRARASGPLLIWSDWALKTYGVAWDGRPEPPRAGDAALEAVLAETLPSPAVAPANGRPGVGWVILHRGRGMDYLVVGWWERENEMPVRVWIREDGGAWRPAGTESFCVWDMELMTWERDAWVRHVLDGAKGDVADYLRDPAPDRS